MLKVLGGLIKVCGVPNGPVPRGRWVVTFVFNWRKPTFYILQNSNVLAIGADPVDPSLLLPRAWFDARGLAPILPLDPSGAQDPLNPNYGIVAGDTRDGAPAAPRW